MATTRALAGVPALGARPRAQPGWGALVAMERRKIARRPQTWICALVTMGGVGALMTLGYIITRASMQNPAERLKDFQLPGGLDTGFTLTAMLGMLALVVVAASAAGGEYGWGTLRTVVGSGVARGRWWAAKLLALGQVALAFLAGGVLAGALASTALTIVGGGKLTLGGVDANWCADLARSLGLIAVVLGVMVAFAFAIATLTRSAAAGIGVGIGWIFFEAIFGDTLRVIGGFGDHLANALLLTNINALMQHAGFGPQDIPPDLPGLWQALGVLLLYSGVLLAASFWVFVRRDIASGP